MPTSSARSALGVVSLPGIDPVGVLVGGLDAAHDLFDDAPCSKRSAQERRALASFDRVRTTAGSHALVSGRPQPKEKR